jgi:iron complex outermembrane recepter protein
VLHEFIRGNVLKDTLNEDAVAGQADLLAQYKTNDGKLQHKTLLTLDVSSNWRYRIQTQPNSKTDPIGNVNTLSPNYALPADSAFNIITRRDHVRWNIMGLFLRQQTSFMDGRLLGFAGVRYDHVTYDMNFGDQFNTGGSKPGSLRTPGARDKFSDNAWTPSLGANFKLTPSVTLYANHSRSFYPNAQVAKLGDPRLPSETGRGWDYGIKASYLEDRLVFTLGGFYILREGVKVKVANTGDIDDTQAMGSQSSKGVEFDFTWRATDDLTLLGGYGYTNARVTESGTDLGALGRRPAGLPIDNGGLAIKYSVSALPGLSFTFGVKYIGLAYPNAAVLDARRNVVNPANTIFDMGATYTWGQRTTSFRHSVRVSVKNLADEDYYNSNFNAMDRRGFFVSYTLNH